MATIPAISSGLGPLCPENSPAEAARPAFKVRVEQAQAFLHQQYPVLFGVDPKPLAIGIHRALLDRHPDLDAPGLKRALTLHTLRRAYQVTLACAGAARVDLDGNPAGEVTEEQAQHARDRLEAMKAEAARKRAEKRKSPEKAAKAQQRPPKPEPPPAPSDALGRPVLRLKPKAPASKGGWS